MADFRELQTAIARNESRVGPLHRRRANPARIGRCTGCGEPTPLAFCSSCAPSMVPGRDDLPGPRRKVLGDESMTTAVCVRSFRPSAVG